MFVQQRALLKLVFLALALGFTFNSTASAEPIDMMDVGDAYYLNHFWEDNELVVVKRIDRQRGLVKIVHQTGDVEWVKPEKLYTKKGVEEQEFKDTVAGIGTAIELYNHINKKKSSSTKKAAESKSARAKLSSKPKYTGINSVDFEPMVDGKWEAKTGNWKDWAEEVLSKFAKKPVAVESVRGIRVPFYSSFFKPIHLLEASAPGGSDRYYVFYGPSLNDPIVLNGSGPPIFELNRQIGFKVDSAKVAEQYAKFYTSMIGGDGGVFSIVEPGVSYMPASDIQKLGIEKLKVEEMDGSRWKVSGKMLYDHGLYNMELTIAQNGKVEMTDSNFAVDVPKKYFVKMDGFRRHREFKKEWN